LDVTISVIGGGGENPIISGEVPDDAFRSLADLYELLVQSFYFSSILNLLIILLRHSYPLPHHYHIHLFSL